MSKRLKKLTMLLTAVVSCAVLAVTASTFVGCKGCDGGTSGSDATSEQGVGSVTLNTSVAELDLGETLSLTASLENLSGEVVWTTSDLAVVSVENGLVTAIAEGMVTVTATVGDYSASCMIRVYNSYKAPTITLNQTEIYVGKAETFTVQATVVHKGTDISTEAEYIWTLADGAAEDIVELTPNGNKASLKGLAYGTTELAVATTVKGVLLTENFTVTVRDAGISFDIPALTPVANGGYEADLYTTNVGGYYKSVSLEVGVYNNGVLIPDASVTFETADTSVAKVEENYLLGVNTGETVVTGSYEGNTFKIAVSVIKPTFTLEQKVVVEVGALVPLALEKALAGEVIDATIDGQSVFASYESATGLSLDKDKLNEMPLSSYGEARLVSVETSEAYYALNADVYSLVIRTAEDYQKIGDISKAAGYVSGGWQYWSGYFVLGNDISDENGIPLNEFVHRELVGSPNGDKGGFVGVFDGKGYNIDGLYKTNTGKKSGFIGIMAGGTLKNLSMTNVVFDDSEGCFITFGGKGVAENLYISYAKILNANGATLYQGATFCGGNNPGLIPTNCFIDASNAEISGNGYYFKLIGKGQYERVGCLYPDDATSVEGESGGMPWGNRCVKANIADIQNDTSYQQMLSKYDTGFWMVVAGVPVPKNLYEKIYADDPAIELTETPPTGIYQGENYKVKPNRAYVTVSANMGVETSGNTVKIPPATTVGTTITVTVASVFDPMNKYEFTMKVVSNYVLEKHEIDLDLQVSGETVSVSENSAEFVFGDADASFGKVASVTLDGEALDQSAFIANGGVLTVQLSAFGYRYGEKTLTVTDANGSKVTIPVLLISKAVSTVEEYYEWGVISKACGYQSGGYRYWGGYFILDADLSAPDGITLNEFITRADVGGPTGSMGGFVGVFDGRGHTIDGLKKISTSTNNSAKSGFIGIMSSGVLKNIALTNVVWDAPVGGLISFGGNTKQTSYENIYVSYKSVSNATDTYVGTFSVGTSSDIRKVFVDASETVWDDASKSKFRLIGQGNLYDAFAIDNRLTADVELTSNIGHTTIASGWTPFVKAYVSEANMRADYEDASSQYRVATITLVETGYWQVVDGILTLKTK